MVHLQRKNKVWAQQNTQTQTLLALSWSHRSAFTKFISMPHENYQLSSFTKLEHKNWLMTTKNIILIKYSRIHAPTVTSNGLPLPYTAGKANHGGSCQAHIWNLLVLPLQKVQDLVWTQNTCHCHIVQHAHKSQDELTGSKATPTLVNDASLPSHFECLDNGFSHLCWILNWLVHQEKCKIS